MSSQREEKKAQFVNSEKKAGLGKLVVVSAVFAIIAGVAGFFLLGKGVAPSDAALQSVNGEIRIDIANVDDGNAHYFTFDSEKGAIKFFVIKSVDGTLRAAFDACDVCYKAKKGYRQEGNMMVCNNCDMKFRTDRINEVKGGCNPAPLKRRIDGGQLVINRHDIINGAWYFGG